MGQDDGIPNIKSIHPMHPSSCSTRAQAATMAVMNGREILMPFNITQQLLWCIVIHILHVGLYD